MGFWKRLFGTETPEDLDPAQKNEGGVRSKREAIARAKADAKPKTPPRRVSRIRRDALELIFAASRESHPHEFGATLRAEGGTVVEIVLVPGTLQGERHAILPLSYLPADRSIVGTVHSHPGPSAQPSDADLQLFRHFGHTHVIVHEPYNARTWVAYDQEGRVIRLDVVE